jgi:acetolactate synthase-1/2/3 large subunit
LPSDFVWVRDVTVSNSTWGNRLLRLDGPRNGVHALGGGIGMGAAMAVGAALAADGRKTVALSGDGGLMLNLGELATAVQEGVDLLLVVMNDKGYGVIRNIQDARFGGRHYYADLHTPGFADLARGLGWKHHRLSRIEDVGALVAKVADETGPRLLEVDMQAIGPFAAAFAGPPVRKAS